MKQVILLALILISVMALDFACKSPQNRVPVPIELTDQQLLSMSDAEIKEYVDRRAVLYPDSGDFYYEQYRQLIKRKRELEEQQRLADEKNKRDRQKGVHDSTRKKEEKKNEGGEDRKGARRLTSPEANAKGLTYLGKERREDTLAKKIAAKRPIEKTVIDDPKKMKVEPDNRPIDLSKRGGRRSADEKKDDSKKENAAIDRQHDKVTDDSLERGGKTDVVSYETHQFTLTKGQRLLGFNILNGPGKDYHLMQDPTPGSTRYYFITDRVLPYIENKDDAIRSLSGYRADMGDAAYETVLKSMNEPSTSKGTGMLEILVCDSMFNADGSRDVFYHPRFTNIKDLSPGDKLGFALFYNPERKQLEIYYSADGDLHRAISSDGVIFEKPKRLNDLNSPYIERDPAISRDGKLLVFASSRNYETDSAGVQLFVAIRNSLNEEFGEPICVPSAYNSVGELFPTIYQCPEGDFIIFKKFFSGTGNTFISHFSIEIKGTTLLPMVPFGEGTDIAYKYITTSYSAKRGNRIISSYPINGYDLYRMHLSTPRKVRINDLGELVEKK